MDSTDSSERSSSSSGSSGNLIQLKERLADMTAESVYDYFSQKAGNTREIMESFEVMKEKLGLARKTGLEVYRGLRMSLGAQNTKAWKAREVLNMLDKRANQKEYMQQKAATGIRVLIIGAGPVGLRLAIDCILLGSEVVVMEKRKTFSRNNVLHLWPFTIEDLRQLGAKKFYGKFCAGAIDHISIKSLQCILLKICLLLGVRFYSGVEFLEIQQPDPQIGWHAKLNPSDHPLNLYEFDVLVGADGARKSRVPGFDRKELRGKLALAVTANFKNYYTREEAAVQEISGVAFIFNQKFFKDLKEDTDIDLENIVYYKDDTHYFVMTAKKDSLLRKGVLMTDYPDTQQLLHRNNVNMEALYNYAIEAAGWSTDLPKLDFMLNYHNHNDVNLFDFTSIHQAEYAARAINRRGKDLYLCLTGDALLEPFWPTGTGCARGFLSAMDTAWLIRRVGQKKSVLEVLCERESIFQRLPQTTPESLTSSIKAYTIDPKSRYPNLHLHRIKPADVAHLYEIDELLATPTLRPGSIKIAHQGASKGDNKHQVTSSNSNGLVGGAGDKVGKIKGSSEEEAEELMERIGPLPIKNRRETEVNSYASSSSRRRSLNARGSVHLAYYAEPEEVQSLKDPKVLQDWLHKQVVAHGVKVTNLTTSWSNGMALCALIYHYHPELIPNFKQLSPLNSISNNQLAFSVAEEHLGINPLLKAEEMARPDRLALLSYLSLFYELFLDAEPAPPTSSDEGEMITMEGVGEVSTPVSGGGVTPRSEPSRSLSSEDRNARESKKKKRRSFFRMNSKKKLLGASPSSAERSWNTKSIKRTAILTPPTSPPPTMVSPVTVGTPLTTIEEKRPLPLVATPKTSRGCAKPPASTTVGFKPPGANSSDYCYFCSKRVYLMERMSANGFFFHRSCFRCSHCKCQLKIGGYSLSKGVGEEKGKFFCNAHYRQLFMSNPEAINYSRAGAGAAGGSGGGAKKDKTPPTEEQTTPSNVPPLLSNGHLSPSNSRPPSTSNEVAHSSGNRRSASPSISPRKSPPSKGSVSPSISPRKSPGSVSPSISPRKSPSSKGSVSPSSPGKSPSPMKSPSPLTVIKATTPPISSSTEEEPKMSSGEHPPDSPMRRPKSRSFLHGLLSRSKKPGNKTRERSGSLDLLSHKSPTSDSDEREESVGRSFVHQIKPSSLPNSPELRKDVKEVCSNDESSTEDLYPLVPKRNLSGLTPSDRVRPYSTTQVEEIKTPRISKSDVLGKKGLVQRLSMGFEQLEQHAKDTQIQLGAEGRERARSMLPQQSSTPLLQPHELDIIEEVNGKGTDMSPTTPGDEVKVRGESTPAPYQEKKIRRADRNSLQVSRGHVEDSQSLHRSSRSINRRPNRKRCGQTSVSRPMVGTYDNSDVAIQERRKQQRRFRDAQLIQREMSQLERQCEELEDVGRQIEQALRDAEGTAQEESLMKSWLGLVNERNGLVRKTSELSLRMKELELEDRQYEIDKKLSVLSSLPDLRDNEMAEFEDLCKQKIKIVDERDELVNQTEEERLRELDEDAALVNGQYSGKLEDDEDQDEVSGNPYQHAARRSSAPLGKSGANKEKTQQKRKSWWNFSKN